MVKIVQKIANTHWLILSSCMWSHLWKFVKLNHLERGAISPHFGCFFSKMCRTQKTLKMNYLALEYVHTINIPLWIHKCSFRNTFFHGEATKWHFSQICKFFTQNVKMSIFLLKKKQWFIIFQDIKLFKISYIFLKLKNRSVRFR